MAAPSGGRLPRSSWPARQHAHQVGDDLFWRRDGGSFPVNYRPRRRSNRASGWWVLTFLRTLPNASASRSNCAKHREHLRKWRFARRPRQPARKPRQPTGEERVRGQHEPRDPHADERHPGMTLGPAQHQRAAAPRAPGQDQRRGGTICSASSTTFSTCRRSRPQVAPGSDRFRDRAHCRQRGQSDSRQGRGQKIELVVDLHAMPSMLRGDGLRIGQILPNFAGNAVSSPSAAASACMPIAWLTPSTASARF